MVFNRFERFTIFQASGFAGGMLTCDWHGARLTFRGQARK